MKLVARFLNVPCVKVLSYPPERLPRATPTALPWQVVGKVFRVMNNSSINIIYYLKFRPFVTFFLLFLFCNENIRALEQNKNPKDLEEKTQEVMSKVNKMNNFLKDFCDGLKGTNQDARPKDAQNPHDNEIKKPSDGIKPKPYPEPGKGSVGSMNSLEQQKHHGESMQLFYKVRDRYQDLQGRFADLQKHGQEVKKLQEQWANSKYDKGIYAQYAEEKSKYDEALKGYNKDLGEHREMKKQYDEMRKLVVAR